MKKWHLPGIASLLQSLPYVETLVIDIISSRRRLKLELEVCVQQNPKSSIHQNDLNYPMKRPNTVLDILFIVLEQQPKFQLFPFVISPNPTIPFLIRKPIIPISFYFPVFFLPKPNLKSSKSQMSKADLEIPNLNWFCSPLLLLLHYNMT